MFLWGYLKAQVFTYTLPDISSLKNAETNQSVPYRVISGVSYEIHIENINILCGQNSDLSDVEPYGTYNNH